MEPPLVAVIGSVAIDRIMNFDGHYRDYIDVDNIEVLSIGVLVDSLEIAEGGTGGNITANLAKLGEKPVLLSSVGHDAKAYTERLAALGVDTSKIHYSDLPTASFNVLTDKSENQVGGFYPGAMSDSDSITVKDTSSDTLIWLGAYDPATMLRISQEATQNNLKLFYDPGQQVTNVSANDIKAGIQAAFGLVVNEYEHQIIKTKTGMSDEEILSMLDILIVTHGKHGSKIYMRGKETLEIEPVAPSKIADPTGAGDAYRSGFIYGYLRQWDVLKCGRLGSVMASFALEQQGPQADINREQIAIKFKDSFNEEL